MLVVPLSVATPLHTLGREHQTCLQGTRETGARAASNAGGVVVVVVGAAVVVVIQRVVPNLRRRVHESLRGAAVCRRRRSCALDSPSLHRRAGVGRRVATCGFADAAFRRVASVQREADDGRDRDTGNDGADGDADGVGP